VIEAPPVGEDRAHGGRTACRARLALDTAERDAAWGQERTDVDVIEVVGGRWVARCDCGRVRVFADQPTAWEWLLEHACPVTEETPGETADEPA
jgi:hypothetical protein